MIEMSKIQGRMNLLASSELRRIGQSSALAEPTLPVRPSVIAGIGLAGMALGSHFVPKQNPMLKKALIGGAVVSGLVGAYLLYTGK